jgi:hypothetical protein
MHTMEYYLATKNEITAFSGKWMELDHHVKQSKSDSEKQTSYVFSYKWNLVPKKKRHEYKRGPVWRVKQWGKKKVEDDGEVNMIKGHNTHV